QRLSLVLAQAQFFRQRHGIHPYTLQVFAGGFVLGFDGQRERFDRSQVQIRDLLGVLLLGLKLSEIKTIRSVHQVNRRQDQQRRLPSDVPVQELDQPRQSSSDHVIRERPQITV